jgi:cell division protein ZapA
VTKLWYSPAAAKPLAPRNLLLGFGRRAADVEAMPRGSTEVEIFGAVYSVRGNDDRGYLQGLADLVDRKMREVAEHVNTADTVRIAILAALNLADELMSLEKRQEGERVLIREKVAELTEELAGALET